MESSQHDSSVECLDEKHFENRIECKTLNMTKSLFNLTSGETMITGKTKEDDLEFKIQEERLVGEMKEWKTVFNDAYKQLQKSKEEQPVIDKRVLSADKLAYLNEAPCLRSFLRESLEFRRRAHLFTEYTYAEFNDMLDNLRDLSQQRLTLTKSNIIDENRALLKRGNK